MKPLMMTGMKVAKALQSTGDIRSAGGQRLQLIYMTRAIRL